MITTVINFCTNEYPFLNQCIQSVKAFSQQILIPVADHFFDGTKEKRALLNKAYAEHPDCTFLEYGYTYQFPRQNHNVSRLIGYQNARSDFILFLDVDEIIDSEKFCAWLKTFEGDDGYYLWGYWYFREPKWRAKTWEKTSLLVKKSALSESLLMVERERAGTFDALLGKKREKVLSLENLPMVHHYSWVRTKEQMLRKVESWGHRHDRDWHALVLEEFSRPFNGKDFVHGYEFEEVESCISIPMPT